MCWQLGVFHTASPAQFSVTDPQAELVEPAVKGTLNVLKSCVKFPTVKRVVITSSMAAVMMTGKPLTSDVVLDETYYSDPLFCEKIKLRRPPGNLPKEMGLTWLQSRVCDWSTITANS
ncbi:hypothetical protein ACFX15_028012 [Malus domestica]